MYYAPREVIPSSSEQDNTRAYALAWSYDPLIQKRHLGKYVVPFRFVDQYQLFCYNSELIQSGELVAQAFRKDVLIPINMVFALTSGDIGFFSGAVLPLRTHNVAQGVYSKLGEKPENRWLGLITTADLPYVVNPDKGYVVNANNFITSDQGRYGASHAFTFPHRKVRISEMIEELIEGEGKREIDGEG